MWMRPPSRAGARRSPALVGRLEPQRRRGRIGRLEVERAVRPPAVVVAHVDAEHMLELAAADDQQPVGALAADAADPALYVRVRVRRRTGVRMILTPSLAKTESNAAENRCFGRGAGDAPGLRARRGPSAGCAPAAASRPCPGSGCRPGTRPGGCRSTGRRARTDAEARRCRRLGSRRRGSSRRAGAGSYASSADRAPVPAGCRRRREHLRTSVAETVMPSLRSSPTIRM
jgi:hypothetical protein